MYTDMKKTMKLVKQKFLTRRIGIKIVIKIVIMKKLCKQEVIRMNVSVQGK